MPKASRRHGRSPTRPAKNTRLPLAKPKPVPAPAQPAVPAPGTSWAIPQWQAGMAIQGPVYLDANLVVGGLINSQPLYQAASRLIGDLMSNQTPILMSDLVLGEVYWALAKLAYCDLMHQWNKAKWGKDIYRRNRLQIFAQRSAMTTAGSAWLRALVGAGYPLDVVRSSPSEWMGVVDQSQALMRDYGLTANDAIHLALARTHARTFITADRDFNVVAGAAVISGLSILHV
jgi:predicted nucleic acid-binding protein